MDKFFEIGQLLKKKVAKLEKRFRFFVSVAFLDFLMMISTFFLFDKALIFIVTLSFFAYLLTYLSLLEGIEKIEWLTLFIMPVSLTVSFYLFYFLFPVRWLTRIPFLFFYGISIYAVLLCSNIFNVGVEKSLQLYRAAFSVNFLYQLILIFLLLNTVFSFKLFFVANGLIVYFLVFLLAGQLLWTIKLTTFLDKTTFSFAFLIAFFLAELAIIGSFVPVKPTIFALFLTSSYYSLAGLIYNYLNQRLFKETIREYVLVWVVVFVIILLSLNW